jgi:predicted nucleic acid-binding OB-fold protein
MKFKERFFRFFNTVKGKAVLLHAMEALGGEKV